MRRATAVRMAGSVRFEEKDGKWLIEATIELYRLQKRQSTLAESRCATGRRERIFYQIRPSRSYFFSRENRSSATT